MPGNTSVDRVDEGIAGVGVDARDQPDRGERQGQDREERQEPEVGHSAGLLAALHLPRSGPGCAAGGRRTADAPERLESFLGTGHRASPTGIGSGLQREVPCRLPTLLLSCTYRWNSSTSNSHSKSASSANAWSSRPSSRWCATVTCGWYGILQIHVERPPAYDVGELLALGDALDQGHEDHRRDRPERAGAAQVHRERADLGGGPREVILDDGEVVTDLGRRHQGDVGRDRRRHRVADGRPVVLELAGPGLRDRDRDADGRHQERPAGATKPTRW